MLQLYYWGRTHEDIARQLYITTKTHQCDAESHTIQVTRSGNHISIEHPWLAASPDGHVVDPSESVEQRYGILEIKCPYSARRMTPDESEMYKSFMIALAKLSDTGYDIVDAESARSAEVP